MAVKKLYTENYIRDIADALRTVIGGTDTYNTQEMAATLATIHRGAKDVWIGDQIAYDGLPSYDVEICYIIFDNNKVMRVYAGTVILYDDPVVWDYSLPTTVFHGTNVVDTGMEIFSSENFNRPFEMYVHISNYTAGMRFMGIFDAITSDPTYGLYLMTENGQTMRFMGTTPEFNSGPVEFNYKLRRDAYRTLYIYDMNNNEELIFTTGLLRENPMTSKSWELGGYGGQALPASFTLHDFRFRWLNE